MKVILYCRVSTDEQADNCSLVYQEARLRKYCSDQGYEVINVYREQYSAKSNELNRPEFKKIFDYCKKHKHEVDKVLFLRWDRYARNVEFAFAYKRRLYDELGVEINALESGIDFKSTEWSTLLALYTGVAHTEDEKISRRTKDGIHGTRLKGKWSSKAPRGYKNVRVAKHDCWVEVDEPEAEKIKSLFVEVAKGLESPTLIKKRLYPNLPSSTFFAILRNKFYVGIIHAPAYGDDPEQDVVGQHEALVDRQTFDTVQEIIDGKRKQQPKLSKPLNPNLYLRKFLVCPVCGHVLTGGESRGNGGLYPYYFCSHEHKHLNARAENVNSAFVKYVSQLKPNKAVLALYNEILEDVRGENVKANHAQADRLEKQKDSLVERINKVNDLYFDGEIDKSEKESNIARYQAQIDTLQYQIDTLKLSADLKIKDKLEYSINLIGNLGEFFATAAPEVKIKLLGSIFPEKIEFDGKNYRTKSYNRMLDIIYKETKHLQGKRKSEFPEITENSDKVPEAGIEPARL